MKILAICGSLRAESTNGILLNTAKAFLSEHQWTHLQIDKFPFFDPDNQFSDKTPEIIQKARELAASADLIFITTPEYAHGPPGVLKNALEWIFFEKTEGKPIALVIGSAQGEHTKSQLIEILTTMNFKISAETTLLVQGARSKISLQQHFKDNTDMILFHQFCRRVSSNSSS